MKIKDIIKGFSTFDPESEIFIRVGDEDKSIWTFKWIGKSIEGVQVMELSKIEENKDENN